MKFPKSNATPKGKRKPVADGDRTLQRVWRQTLGVNVALNRRESKVLIAFLFAHDFDLSISGYYPIDDPSHMLARAEKDGPGNFSTWHDPRFEAASREVKQATEEACRAPASPSDRRRLLPRPTPVCHPLDDK